MNRGAYIGRFNPLHKGHQAIIDAMLKEHGPENCLLVLGSSSAPFSLRHYFSYEERSGFIKALYPELKLLGLPDYHDDKIWLLALDDILRAVGFDPRDVQFFGGSLEDIRFFADDGRKYKILSRFDGSSPKISATEVRDALIYDRLLTDYIDARIKGEVRRIFKEKWEKFKKI